MSFSRDPAQPWRWNPVNSPETAIQRVPVAGPTASHHHDVPPLGFPTSLSASGRSGRASPGRAIPGPMVGRRDWRAPWDREVGPPTAREPSPIGSLSSRVDRAAGASAAAIAAAAAHAAAHAHAYAYGNTSPGRASPGRASPARVERAAGRVSPSRAQGRVSPSAAGRVDRALEVRQA